MQAMTAPALRALLENGALTGEWVLDPGKSSVGLKSRSMGLFVVNGVFREVSGNGTVAPDGAISGTVTVAAGSIDTKQAKRDAHLRSADFFDSDNHPSIIFTADGIRLSGQGVAVTGALTVRDRTRPLSFDAAASAPDDSEIWLDAEIVINRTDFGLTWNLLGLVAKHTTLTIHTVFTPASSRLPGAWAVVPALTCTVAHPPCSARARPLG
jgi:polyisoprenoid-binding protein YceI